MNLQISGVADGSHEQLDVNPVTDYATLGLELLLFGLQSPVNIGMILRIAEAYEFKVSILDTHQILHDPDKFSTTSDFSCGALSRRVLERLDGPAGLARLRIGRRIVATSIGRNAQSLPTFRFLPGDLILLGNEYDGLPDDVVAGADALLQIPTPVEWMPKERSHSPIDPIRIAPVSRDGQPSLNVAVAAGIVCYAAYAGWLAKPTAEERAGRLPAIEAVS